ncbi:hypothetical protein [Vibrio marisflavi]|uniref:DUF2933 domain-containing protein n=1 Tax=Vibrio marisflavi CECT 7928 TaxID=634439 RepID=A0ABN8E130_9VIBR|nr:hypothetical protein [Vibrio marisflavi]CAH0537096.1 hypothetical protein VMF7928_00932 [Vibrio marisflavi CECT 7928]
MNLKKFSHVIIIVALVAVAGYLFNYGSLFAGALAGAFLLPLLFCLLMVFFMVGMSNKTEKKSDGIREEKENNKNFQP